MKSGLEGRNNTVHRVAPHPPTTVSMKSGLEGRNNYAAGGAAQTECAGVSQ